MLLSPALAHGLVQQNGCGRRRVQGGNVPLHGDADQKIAVFRHQAAHAVALGADDDGRGTLQVGAVQVRGGPGGGAEDPDPLFFQVLQGGGKVGHPGHRQIADGSGGGLAHDGGEAGGPALGDDEPMGPGTLGGAEDGPQIVGVGDLVAHHQQRRLPLGGGAVQNALDADVFPDGGQGDDSLVGVGAAHGVQLPPVGLHHNNPGVPGPGGNVAQGLVRLALGQVNFVDGRSGPQGLDHGVPALDEAVGLRLGGGPSGFVVSHGAMCVEVVRGGGSALFGANAVGGTINIITKDPVSNSFQVSSTLSNMNGKVWEQYMGANASLVSKDNTYGIALYQSYRNRNPYDADGDGFSELGKLNMNTFGLRTYYRPTQFSRISLEYHTTNEFRRGGNKFDLEPFETDITEQTKHVINSGGLSYDIFWKEYKHKLSFYSSVQNTDRNSYYGAQQNPDAYGKTKDLTWVVGGMYVGNFEKVLFSPATFTAGMEYQNNSLHDIMLGYHRDMKQDVRIAGGFVQNEWKMNRFILLAGFRVDSHNLIDNPIFSPRVNLLYKPTDKFQARLTWSTGFRAPQAYDEDLHVTAVGGEGVLIKLADGLKPEHSNSFSGSVDWTANIGHWQTNLLLEAFYTGLDDVFVLEKIGQDEQGNTVKERRNGNGARVYGVNLDGKLAHGRDVALQVGFTVQRSRYTKYENWSEDENVEPTKFMPRTPDYYGYFTLTSAPFKNFDMSVSGVYTGRMHVPHLAPDFSVIPENYEYSYIRKDELVHTPDFFDLNLKLNYTFVLNDHIKLQLNGGVQNLFNAFQKDLDKGGFRDSGYFYGPTQPRTYFIGVKITN